MNAASAIEQTFLHCPGIGPVTEARIKERGYGDWQTVLRRPEGLPLGARGSSTLLQALARSRDALARDDIQYFIDHFSVKEHWRVLAAYFDRISYFDIETNGLSYDAYVTCIVCYHRGSLWRFLRGENLDDFLALLDEVQLLVSFNGASFDIPQLLRTWHIPQFPCPHIDLRWQCYHDQLRGGLKQVEQSLEIDRPTDLQGADGAEAVWLWYRWHHYGNRAARGKLLRYCGADVLSLRIVCAALLEGKGWPLSPPSHQAVWDLLDGGPQAAKRGGLSAP